MPAPKDPEKREEWIRKNREAHIDKHPSQASRDKMSKAQKNKPKKPFTKKHCENISKSCKGRVPWNKNIPHKQSSKDKMSAKKKDIPLSEDHKKHIGESNKGKHNNVHHNPEALEANRLAHLNKSPSQHTRDLMSIAHKDQIPWNKGIPTPKEICDKMSKSMSGIKRSDDFRKSIRGKNNNNWNGGTTEFFKTIRELPEMTEWKINILKRDDYRDCFTGQRGNHNLDVHHIIPMSVILMKNNIDNVEDALNCKELWNVDNGISMFKKSHIEHHNKYGMSILQKDYYFNKK